MTRFPLLRDGKITTITVVPWTAFLTTWRGEVHERAARTRHEPGGGKMRAQVYSTVRRARQASVTKEKRSHGGRIACFGRRLVRNAGWSSCLRCRHGVPLLLSLRIYCRQGRGLPDQAAVGRTLPGVLPGPRCSRTPAGCQYSRPRLQLRLRPLHLYNLPAACRTGCGAFFSCLRRRSPHRHSLFDRRLPSAAASWPARIRPRTAVLERHGTRHDTLRSGGKPT